MLCFSYHATKLRQSQNRRIVVLLPLTNLMVKVKIIDASLSEPHSCQKVSLQSMHLSICVSYDVILQINAPVF